MKDLAFNFDEMEKLTILLFDEMKVEHTVEYDPAHDEVGLHNII